MKDLLKQNFNNMRFSTFEMLFDPLLSVCFKKSPRKRLKLLEKSDELFNQELNIKNMLEKIR